MQQAQQQQPSCRAIKGVWQTGHLAVFDHLVKVGGKHVERDVVWVQSRGAGRRAQVNGMWWVA